MDCDPLKGSAPDQPPPAEQAVALLLDQVSVEVAPEATEVGLAANETCTGNCATVTVADCTAEPPSPVQVNSYSVELVRGPVDQLPMVATGPLQPPEAVHELASVVDHVIVALAPFAIVVGVALMMMVGAAEVTTTSADCAADPPAPVQVSV